MAEAAPNPNPSPVGPNGEDFAASVPESWRTAQAQRTSPARRIVVMEDSMRCLTCGWLSLVPVLGVAFVISAVSHFRRVDRERAAWNPAAHLWLRGLVLASFGCWTNLFWLWLVFCALGDNEHTSDGDLGMLLVYVLAFGSAPTLLGLGYAATRWSNRFGQFAHRTRVGLLVLMVTAYGTLLYLVWMNEAERSSARTAIYGLSEVQFVTQITLWMFWLIGGFIGLAMRGVKSWWWLAWLAGAALLTAWVGLD